MELLQMKTSGRSLIYSMKSVGPWIESFRSPVLVCYSCQNSSSRTTRRCLLEQIISGALLYLSVEILAQKLKIIDNIKVTHYHYWFISHGIHTIDLLLLIYLILYHPVQILVIIIAIGTTFWKLFSSWIKVNLVAILSIEGKQA